MKLTLKTLLLPLALSISCLAFSQQCTSDSLILLPTGTVIFTQPGFIDPNMLPCISSGNYSELDIPFNTYNQGARLLLLADSSTVPVSHIYSIQVTNVTGLPSGLCWVMNPSSQIITGNQVGQLIIKGTTTVASGTYPLSVSINIDTQGSGASTYTNLTSLNYKALLGQVVVKVMGPDYVCPQVTN